MSQHPSLRSSDKDKAQRSVLKRYERIKILKDKEKWTENDSVYKLPKIKIAKFKIKKEKAATAETPLEGAPAAGLAASPADTKAAPGAGKGAAKTAAAMTERIRDPPNLRMLNESLLSSQPSRAVTIPPSNPASPI